MGCFTVPVMANDLYSIPTYNGSQIWEDSINRMLTQILSRVIMPLTPVNGRISSNFGWRMHPILKRASHHNGVDIACKSGSPVKAALSGQIIFSGEKGGYGNLIQIAHIGMYNETRYGHLSKLLVTSGDHVTQGQLIGYSGMTGRATGPHLHFEVYEQGTAIDAGALMR